MDDILKRYNINICSCKEIKTDDNIIYYDVIIYYIENNHSIAKDVVMFCKNDKIYYFDTNIIFNTFDDPYNITSLTNTNSCSYYKYDDYISGMIKEFDGKVKNIYSNSTIIPIF